MKPQLKLVPLFIVLWLLFLPDQALAAIDNVGVLNTVLDRFEAAAATWRTVMIARATWLFWLLVMISMVWTFGMMALRKADLGEFFTEFLRFTMFTGFFWWLLLNGPQFAVDVMKSLRTVGAQASGLPNDLGPSGIVDVGFDIFFKVVDQANLWKPIDSLFGMLLGVGILIVFALVGTNMLLLLVSGYLFAYAGVFILGFGGSKWTSEMAIGYYRSILNVALQLMAMVLIIGIGRSFLDQYYTAMSAGIQIKELGVIAVVAAVLLFLVAKVPPQIGALAGGVTGNLGSNFGVGAAVTAAALGAAAAASVGSAMVSGAASAAGGTRALMAALSKASAVESSRDGISSIINAVGSAEAESSASESPLGAAMGDSGGSVSGSPNQSHTFQPANSFSSGASDRTASEGGVSPPSAGGSSSNETGGAEERSSDQAQGRGNRSAAGAIVAKVGRVAAHTVVNLAQGSWDVLKAKASDASDCAMDRIGETTGGKIAVAIKAGETAAKGGLGAAQFDENSLSAGTDSADFESEVAAFRDRKSKPS